MTLPKPQSRAEQYLNNLATGTGELPPKPLSRMEMYLDYIAKNGGISSGDGSGHYHANKEVLDSLSKGHLNATDTIYEHVEGSNISVDTIGGDVVNLEILGNTIQDPNDLSDIRSTGDEVEGQNLYKIPLSCVGKNLLDLRSYNWKNLYIDGGSGKEAVNSDFLTSNYIRIKSQVVFSGNSNSTSRLIYYYDENETYVGTAFNPNAKLCRVRVQRTDKTKISVNDLQNMDLQLEEGTQATPYEPYVEDKLTILSPCQIEKVGDIADRIIEKDGVWGVEKNILDNRDITFGLYRTMSNVTIFNTKSEVPNIYGDTIISNKLIQAGWHTDDTVGMSIYGKYVYIRVANNELSSLDEAGINEWLKSNNFYIKYPVTNPTFIPLPHDQQVKLRTFANKTNIQFLTEVEGTIKADVPKSLGASVNSNTKAIQDINQDLERVKKLEEATTSTVTTESNFVTIEETSNGYLSDIKLEGRTLIVNSQNEEVDAGTEGATLKSLGDDVDEIVVSSVENCKIHEFTDIQIAGTALNGNIKNISNSFYLKNISSNEISVLIGKNGAWVRDVIAKGNFETFINLNEGEYVYRFTAYFNKGWTSSNVDLLKRSVITNISSIKQDEKRILYYDPQDQTWKKPALREFDSIEKHSDGKYYYHVRSGENVLNGSEGNISLNNTYPPSNPDLLRFDISIATGDTSLFCDKFSLLDPSNSGTLEGVRCHTSKNMISIFVLKSKLTTQDLAGFKAWLQANNVTVVYQLTQEEVYECTPIDLTSFENQTNFMVESGVLSPKTTIKVQNYIGNVINTLKEKVSYLEDKLYKTNLANFIVSLNTLETKLRLEQLTKTPR